MSEGHRMNSVQKRLADYGSKHARHLNPFDYWPFSRWQQRWVAWRIDCFLTGHIWKGGFCIECGKEQSR